MSQEPNLKPSRSESAITFQGMRKFQATEMAKIIFSTEAFFKIEMDFDKRIFNIYVWSDLAENKDKNKLRMESKCKQCKIHFIKKDK